MNVFTWLLFPLVIGYFITPTISGLRWMVRYKLNKSNYQKNHELGYVLIPILCAFIFGIVLIIATLALWVVIMKYEWFDYIISVICCLLVSITASEKIYLPVNAEINSYGKAFRKGYTEGISMRVFPFIQTKTAVHIVYLMILIASHIITLYFKDAPIYNSDIYEFLEVNKYGIVIMYAFEKIISSISKKEESERIKILNETSKEMEEHDKQSREEFEKSKQNLKAVLKQRKQAKMLKKRQNTNFN